MNLGENINALYELKEKKAELNKLIEIIEEKYTKIENDIIIQLRDVGMTSGEASRASATISESIVPTVKDWDKFYQYINETNSLFLLEKRPSVTAYRDLLQAGEEIPGVEPFTKTKLSLKKRRSI